MKVQTLFFATAALAALIGMLWGIHMSANHDYALSPAHGHLNLIGFAVMAVYGTYYALTPEAAESMLSKIHYLLALAGLILIVPGIVLALHGTSEVLAKTGSVLTLLSMALFLFTILRKGVGTKDQ